MGYEVKEPLYHDNTVLRTEDFSNLRDAQTGNLLAILRALSGFDGIRYQAEFGKWRHGSEYPAFNNGIGNELCNFFVFDGFLPCDFKGNVLKQKEGMDADLIVEQVKTGQLHFTPGIGLFCADNRYNSDAEIRIPEANKLVVSSEVKTVNLTADGADWRDKNFAIMGRAVEVESEPKNILTRDSNTGKSYVKQYNTMKVYDIEFTIAENVIDQQAIRQLMLDGWFPFAFISGGGSSRLFMGSFQTNFSQIVRELYNAGSEKKPFFNYNDACDMKKDPSNNLVRWGNGGKLQTRITENYKTKFDNVDLVNRYYVDMVMQDEKTRIDTILREQYDILPPGTILMFNGTNWQNDSTIPGWYMCDGQNGTPDLRERFIAGCSYSTGRTIPNAPGNFGGDNSFRLKTDHLPAHAHSIPAHNHTATVGSGGAQNKVKTSDAAAHSHGMEKDGTHKHGMTTLRRCSATWSNSWPATGGEGAIENKAATSDAGSHSHTINPGGAHSHTIDLSAHTHSATVSTQPQGTSGTIGGNASVDMSKSIKGYALIFIMKTK